MGVGAVPSGRTRHSRRNRRGYQEIDDAKWESPDIGSCDVPIRRTRISGGQGEYLKCQTLG